MARLESESKGGFYPTPSEEMEFILKRLRVDEGSSISLLDPCCGKGDAIQQMKQYCMNLGAQPITYGIEIEKTRAEEAKERVDHVLACGYEDVRMSHGAFSLLYLNPPFMEFHGDRAETIFFRDLTAPDSYIPVGGLVIFNLPQYILGHVAKLISIRLKDVKVYSFTEENYAAYKQVIVYGYRKAPGSGRDKDLQAYLEWISSQERNVLPSLDNGDWKENYYKIPQQIKPVELFQSGLVEPEDIIQSLKEGHFFSKVIQKIEDGQLNMAKATNPAMPLKISHMATAIAAGALPEAMGDHMLVGVTKRIQIERSDMDEDTGKIRESVTYKPKSMVRIFSKSGIFNLE